MMLAKPSWKRIHRTGGMTPFCGGNEETVTSQMLASLEAGVFRW
jgi:hypothetical protein